MRQRSEAYALEAMPPLTRMRWSKRRLSWESRYWQLPTTTTLVACLPFGPLRRVEVSAFFRVSNCHRVKVSTFYASIQEIQTTTNSAVSLANSVLRKFDLPQNRRTRASWRY